jgi:hypothetical protein
LNAPAIAVRSTVTASLILAAVCSALPQSQPNQKPPASVAETKAQELKLYADARPYVDEPVPQLQRVVRDLDGLKPTTDQESLPALLTRIAESADQLLGRLPNLISDEGVTQRETAFCDGCTMLFRPQPQNVERFSYIILAHPVEEHQLVLEEYRMTRDSKPVPEGKGPFFAGFTSYWIIFTSFNRAESRFRYLGQQKVDGHATFVVAFAQIPGTVSYPPIIASRTGSIPMLVQGVAWIDQTDFRIVRLRMDLLAPQPEVEYMKLVTDIQFGRVRIQSVGLELWLPVKVRVATLVQGELVVEEHKYSNFRLYKAQSKVILPSP